MKNYFWYVIAGVIVLTGVAVVSAMMMAAKEQTTIITSEEEVIITPIDNESPEEEIPPTPTQPTPPPTEQPPITTPAPSKECFVGGCSGQICSDQSDMITTCEWRSEYACYKTATCEVQSSGDCGWTPSTELNACLANPPSDME
ncbi:MAG: hypothetical protein ACK42D_02840 [Candidatus Paceibacteria bacterium]